MQHPPTASESEVPPSTAITVSILPRRARLAVVGLVLLTVASLGLAWCFPDMTLLHFLWVAQGVPVLYLVLAWWGTQPPQSDDAS